MSGSGDRRLKRSRRRAPRWSMALAMLVMAGFGSDACSSGSSVSTSGADATSSRAPTLSQASESAPGSSASSPTTPPCPNDEGGDCIGPLTAGRSYTTSVFAPAITYSVPTKGWSNFEDLPGNFLLVPPGSDLAGVNRETSDYIGVFQSVQPSVFSNLPSCDTALVPGISTPRAMVAWLQRQSSLAVTRPSPVTLSGLHGLMIDISPKPGKKLPTCQVEGHTFHDYLVLSGVAPSSFDHGAHAGMTMRLYLLAYHDKILAVELDDVAKAPGNLASLSAVAEQIHFAT